MDEQHRIENFTITADILDELMSDVEQLAGENVWPLYMLDHAGHPLFINSGDDFPYEIFTWDHAIGTFIVQDDHGRIQWLHPALRERLDDITEEYLMTVVPDLSHQGKTVVEIAKELYQDSRKRISALDRRMKSVQPIVDFFEGDQVFKSVAEAREVFSRLSKKHSIDEDIVWSLAQIMRKVPVARYDPIGRLNDYYTAAILSQMIDPTALPVPTYNETYSARILIESISSELDAPHNIETLARAMAHQVLPMDPGSFSREVQFNLDLFEHEINIGKYDPHPDQDVSSCDMAARIGEFICGYGSPTGEPVSAHETVRLVGVATARLVKIGRNEKICLTEAKRIAVNHNEIPF